MDCGLRNSYSQDMDKTTRTLSDTDVSAAANSLLEAYQTGAPIAPLRETYPGMTLDDAYAIQAAQEEAFAAKQGPVTGRKIGLTSVAMQKQLGVDSPDFGFFTAAMSHGDNATVPAASFISPKVEPEFAFRLSKDLQGPGVTVADVREAIESVHPAIEIIDSRIADWNIRLVDTVADNASCGAVVIGETPLDVTPEQLTEVACSLVINGETTGSGTGADVLDDPAAPVAWLANLLGEHGQKLAAGDWILPGSFCGAAPVESGSTATADFGELGSVTVTF